ncbi:MAG TPA: hypothetical protein DDZ88_31465, partial [Verrucomicrobiales bacterium]|nr:hypothetical protein [Verrucomicrobiales bacterium]
MTPKDEDSEGQRRKRWWEDRDFIPIGPKRVSEDGKATMQEGIAFLPIQPFPEPEAPKTTVKDTEPGWIKEQRRDSNALREPDWNFKAIIDAQSTDEAAACAWYEYARECAKIRAVASTYTVHYRLASGMGRMSRYREGKDRWAKERLANQAKREDIARRLFETLNRRIDGLKRDGKHKFAEEFGRKWHWKINDIECHESTPSFDWITRKSWMRIDWLKSRMEKRCEKLREARAIDKAKSYEARWKPKLESMQQDARAWDEALSWMSKIEGKCSIGAPCLHSLAPWLNEDSPWREISDSKDPSLDVRSIAIRAYPVNS